MTIPQGDIIKQEGDKLEIFCILHDEYMNTADHLNSSYLVFQKDDKLLPNEMIEVVNASTIRLYVENVTASTNNFICRFNNTKKENICMNKVAIDSKLTLRI